MINNIANNNRPSVTIGNINVTCPGVTDKQVAEKLPYVLDDVLFGKLDDAFSVTLNATVLR